MNSGVIVDWLSFTIPSVRVTDSTFDPINIDASLSRALPEFWELLPGQWEERSGRAPYVVSYTQAGVMVFYSPKLDHVLVEVQGQGCAMLGQEAVIGLMRRVMDDITRVDIAKDYAGDKDPIEALERRKTKRFKAHSQAVSSTGTTVYIGSRKSERYARIYRYNKPHPRAGVTRCEFVSRKQYAVAMATAIVHHGIGGAFAYCHNIFGLDVSYSIDAEPAPVKLERGNRSIGKTMLWVHRVVAPVLKRMVECGEIDDIHEWVEAYVK